MSKSDPSYDLLEMVHALIQAPSYHLILEVLLIVWIVRLLFMKSYKPERTDLSEKEKQELLDEWQPEPLVPDVPENDPVLQNLKNNVVSSKLGKIVTVNGKKCVNMATLNFLGMVGNSDIEEAAVTALRKYGVGSCGPRGFYGTVDVHLDLEKELAEFMQCERAILYSYGFATIASAIPAYSKRGDIIYADEGVCFAIQKGILASRSKVHYFKHNDMEDLERLLKAQEAEDRKNPKKAKVTRKFIVVEGLYIKYADLVPLPKVVELKWKYKVRIFIDESLSFGTLGAHGRGVTEHYNVPMEDVDLISASLENSIGSVGGFCCGKEYVVDHQVLSGLGYCFSASQPPMLAVAGSTALKILQEHPDLLSALCENSQYLHNQLQELEDLLVEGYPSAPVKHVYLRTSVGNREQDRALLQSIVELARDKGVAFTLASYQDEEQFLPPPSIRVAVSTEMTTTDLDKSVQVLRVTSHQVLSQH